MPRILLCGSSLLIAGLQASLEAEPGPDVQRVQLQADLLPARFSEWEPDVLVLELDAETHNQPLALLKEFPHLTLIGLDPESERLLLLSVQQETPLAVTDFLRLIRERTEVTHERRLEGIASRRSP